MSGISAAPRSDANSWDGVRCGLWTRQQAADFAPMVCPAMSLGPMPVLHDSPIPSSSPSFVSGSDVQGADSGGSGGPRFQHKDPQSTSCRTSKACLNCQAGLPVSDPLGAHWKSRCRRSSWARSWRRVAERGTQIRQRPTSRSWRDKVGAEQAE